MDVYVLGNYGIMFVNALKLVTIFLKYTKKGYTSIFVVVVWCAMHDNIIRCFATSCTREISNIKIVINILLKVIGKTIEQNKLLL